ncbi:MAG: hypothetical protein KAS69_07090 [Planctomycetes bacterium]|nr:hypothetical protein [Planctomycetota bacterium]
MGCEKGIPNIFSNLLFPRIFQSFRMAIQPSKLIIAFMALAIICLAGWMMDLNKTVAATANTQGKITELQIYIANPARVDSYIKENKEKGEFAGVFSTLWNFASVKFHGTLNSLFALDAPGIVANITEYFAAVKWAFKYHFVYSIIFFVIKLAVIAIAGGSLCRISALQFAKGEKPGITEALRFSRKKFASFFTTPIAPIGVIVFIGLFIFLLGLITNIPVVGEIIMAVSMPLAILAGLVIVAVLIGTAAGFNLMYPAIAYDSSDCFDAISRSFSYVCSKPWRMGFYSAIAVVYGAICYTFVRFLAFLLLTVTRQFLQFGVWVDSSSKEINKLAAIWPEPSFVNLFSQHSTLSLSWSESLAFFLIHLFVLIIVGLVISFVISFYFSANTIIYAALRNRVDNTDLQDIYTCLDGSENEEIIESTSSEKSRTESD